ncbi:MAG: aminoacetone oxidase family FAD-binding enzyme [Candidatus Omnitrophica bacterium]|nr:aminoacetone oxidase family FAD-binding enzyme [Candidatus Omnitrophota bacterium]
MENTINDLIIIGAGAAGLMAAAEASQAGLRVLVLEGQREPGLKILITGGGRCNVTNARISEKDFNAGCSHTLRHVLKTFPPRQAVDFFEKWGAPLALQETGEFFSGDNKARTVRDALIRAVEHGGARILCDRKVSAMATQDGQFNVVAGHDVFVGKNVLVTTGGLSYPATGSDGSGYHLAESFGHLILPTHPALVPLVAARQVLAHLSGITLPVRLALWAQGRKLKVIEGPLLFTHNGFSGPAPMEMAGPWLAVKAQTGSMINCDFLPQIKGDGIDFVLDPSVARRSVKNIISGFLPERLVLVLLEEAGVDSHRLAIDLSNEDKRSIGRMLRAYPLPVADVMGYSKAEVTAGGVDLKELKGATLESRLQQGLFFAGEVVDVDGRIGGFNLQWAWASGIAAARAIVKKGSL